MGLVPLPNIARNWLCDDAWSRRGSSGLGLRYNVSRVASYSSEDRPKKGRCRPNMIISSFGLDIFGGHLRFGVGGGLSLDLIVVLGDGGTMGSWVVVVVVVAVVLVVMGVGGTFVLVGVPVGGFKTERQDSLVELSFVVRVA
eukprot:8257513-Ditylum_brightwellii.AAC.1